jgi:hypothetical protein
VVDVRARGDVADRRRPRSPFGEQVGGRLEHGGNDLSPAQGRTGAG